MSFRNTHAVSDILDTHRIPVSAHKDNTGTGVKAFKKSIDRLFHYIFIHAYTSYADKGNRILIHVCPKNFFHYKYPLDTRSVS